jgi:hypothetical protein
MPLSLPASPGQGPGGPPAPTLGDLSSPLLLLLVDLREGKPLGLLFLFQGGRALFQPPPFLRGKPPSGQKFCEKAQESGENQGPGGLQVKHHRGLYPHPVLLKELRHHYRELGKKLLQGGGFRSEAGHVLAFRYPHPSFPIPRGLYLEDTHIRRIPHGRG